jgi:hypothetical protein
VSLNVPNQPRVQEIFRNELILVLKDELFLVAAVVLHIVVNATGVLHWVTKMAVVSSTFPSTTETWQYLNDGPWSAWTAGPNVRFSVWFSIGDLMWLATASSRGWQKCSPAPTLGSRGSMGSFAGPPYDHIKKTHWWVWTSFTHRGHEQTQLAESSQVTQPVTYQYTQHSQLEWWNLLASNKRVETLQKYTLR